MPTYVQPPNDDTPLSTRSITSTADMLLRQHLKGIAQQIGSSMKQNDEILSRLEALKDDVGELRGSVGELRGNVQTEISTINGKFNLVNDRADQLREKIDDLDQTRRWAIAALFTSLVTALGSILGFLFHSPKG